MDTFVRGNFLGDMVTDQIDFSHRPKRLRGRCELNGGCIMAAAIRLREVAYPGLYAEAA